MFMTGPMTRARKAAMLGAGVLIAGLLAGTAAQAQGELVVYCGVQEEWCRADGRPPSRARPASRSR